MHGCSRCTVQLYWTLNHVNRKDDAFPPLSWTQDHTNVNSLPHIISLDSFVSYQLCINVNPLMKVGSRHWARKKKKKIPGLSVPKGAGGISIQQMLKYFLHSVTGRCIGVQTSWDAGVSAKGCTELPGSSLCPLFLSSLYLPHRSSPEVDSALSLCSLRNSTTHLCTLITGPPSARP